MEFIQVVFGSNYKIGSLAIKFFTWSRYSHVGVLMPCGKILESTLGKGVTLTSVEDFKSRYGKIEFTNVPCMNAEIAYSIGYAQVNKKYDIKAIISIVARTNFHDDEKWFCSELVAAMVGLYRERRVNRITPEDIFKISRTIPDPTVTFKGTKSHGIRSFERNL